MYARTEYLADGATPTFAVAFPFLDRAHVKVEVAGQAATPSWLSDGLIRLDPMPAAGQKVVVRRETKRDAPVVSWIGASKLQEKSLDASALQSLYLLQEMLDTAEIVTAAVDGADAKNAQLQALIDAQAATIATLQLQRIALNTQIATLTAQANQQAQGIAALDANLADIQTKVS